MTITAPFGSYKKKSRKTGDLVRYMINLPTLAECQYAFGCQIEQGRIIVTPERLQWLRENLLYPWSELWK